MMAGCDKCVAEAGEIVTMASYGVGGDKQCCGVDINSYVHNLSLGPKNSYSQIIQWLLLNKLKSLKVAQSKDDDGQMDAWLYG